MSTEPDDITPRQAELLRTAIGCIDEALQADDPRETAEKLSGAIVAAAEAIDVPAEDIMTLAKRGHNA